MKTEKMLVNSVRRGGGELRSRPPASATRGEAEPPQDFLGGLCGPSKRLIDGLGTFKKGRREFVLEIVSGNLTENYPNNI